MIFFLCNTLNTNSCVVYIVYILTFSTPLYSLVYWEINICSVLFCHRWLLQFWFFFFRQGPKLDVIVSLVPIQPFFTLDKFVTTSWAYNWTLLWRMMMMLTFVAVYQILFRQRHQFPSFSEVLSLHCACCRERPTTSTLSLINISWKCNVLHFL